MATRKLWVLVCVVVGLGACHSSKKAASSARSSEQKIDADEQGGAIDHDHALLYYLYAATANPLLPAAYAADRGVSEYQGELSMVLSDAAVDLPAMPSELQTAFAPYFLRPDQEGSAWLPGAAALSGKGTLSDPTGGVRYMGHVDATVAVRIWYATDAQKALATSIAAEIDSSGMYATEKKIMNGVTPCDDSSQPDVDNGGSGALDMYIIDGGRTFPHRVDQSALNSFKGVPGEASSTFASTVPDRTSNACSTSYVLLLDAQFNDLYKSGLAHELFHAFQYGHPNRLNRSNASWNWVDEATATWAEDQVYPTLNEEQDYLGHALTSNWNTTRTEPPPCAGGRPEAGPLGCNEFVNNPAYSSYLFFFALTRGLGLSPTLVGTIYAQQTMKPLPLLHAAVPMWDDMWKQFALWNFNDGPALHYKDSGADFSSEDLEQGNTWLATAGQSSPPHVEIDHPDDVNVMLGPTRIGYYTLPIDDGTSTDKFVGQLRLDLSELQNKADVHVQAILSYGKPEDSGYHRVLEDWTNLAERKFCRDNAAEQVSSIVIIADNAAIDGAPVTGAIHATPLAACGSYQGTLTQVQMSSGTYTDSSLPGVDGNVTASTQAQSSWTVVFTGRDPDTNDAIYSITAKNTYTGHYGATFDGSTSTYERHDAYSFDLAATVTNPAGPSDPVSMDPDYPPSDPGTIDVDANGNYAIYFITGVAYVTGGYSTSTKSTMAGVYSAANPAPAGSGCGADEVITNITTYDTNSNIRTDKTLFCTEVQSVSQSDPSNLRSAYGQLGSSDEGYAALFMGKLDGKGEIHGMTIVPSTDCNLGSVAENVPSMSTTNCSGMTMIQVDVKLPIASN